MGYCTLQDLIDRFGEQELLHLSPNEAGDAIAPDKVTRAIDDATGEINGYVAAGGYPVPLAPVPAIVVAYCADIARYRLHTHAPDQVSKRYDDAIKFLRAVSSGQVQLGVKEPEPSLGLVQIQPGRQVMKGGGF